MKAAVLKSVGEITIQEVSVPKLRENEALIRVMACGVCGTDVHIFHGDKGAAENPFPIILGHEFSGVIEELGTKQSRFSVGDRVCVDPNVLCGCCEYCLSGLGHFCEHMTGIGTTVNGGFAEYCVVPISQLYKLPETVTFVQGAMAEPIACCLHGIEECGIKPGDRVAVIGGGLIGLIMLQLAKLSGASAVALIEPVAEKRVLAKKLGADITIDPYAEDAARVLEEQGMGRLSAVIECVGNVNTIAQAIALAGKRSVVMMFGLTKPDDCLSIRPFELFQKEIALKSSFINPYTMGRAVELIQRGRIDLESLIAQQVPLSGLANALENPETRRKGKIVVTPWGV